MLFAGCAKEENGVRGSQQKNDFKVGSEPAGFRDIKWGTHLSRIEGLEQYGEPGANGVQSYLRRGEELEIGGVFADRIQYRFWKGKFCAADVFMRGATYWDIFKRSVFERYGEVEQSESTDKKEETYSWDGRKKEILLTIKRIYGRHIFLSCPRIYITK